MTDHYSETMRYFGGKPMLQLDEVAQYLGMSLECLASKINVGKIALPTMRVEPHSQKSQRMVSTRHLVDFLEVTHYEQTGYRL